MTAEQRMCFMCPASTTFTMAVHNTGNDSEKIRRGLDGTVLTKRVYTSSGWSTWQISRREAWVLLARNNSTGLKKTLKAYRPVRPLSCSHISRYGRSILNGVGEPTMPSELSRL